MDKQPEQCTKECDQLARNLQKKFSMDESLVMYVAQREIIERETGSDIEGAATISDEVKRNPKLTVYAELVCKVQTAKAKGKFFAQAHEPTVYKCVQQIFPPQADTVSPCPVFCRLIKSKYGSDCELFALTPPKDVAPTVIFRSKEKGEPFPVDVGIDTPSVMWSFGTFVKSEGGHMPKGQRVQFVYAKDVPPSPEMRAMGGRQGSTDQAGKTYLGGGTINLKGSLDRAAYDIGTSAALTVMVENNCGKEIKGLEFSLKQKVTVTENNINTTNVNDIFTRVLANGHGFPLRKGGTKHMALGLSIKTYVEEAYTWLAMNSKGDTLCPSVKSNLSLDMPCHVSVEYYIKVELVLSKSKEKICIRLTFTLLPPVEEPLPVNEAPMPLSRQRTISDSSGPSLAGSPRGSTLSSDTGGKLPSPCTSPGVSERDQHLERKPRAPPRIPRRPHSASFRSDTLKSPPFVLRNRNHDTRITRPPSLGAEPLMMRSLSCDPTYTHVQSTSNENLPLTASLSAPIVNEHMKRTREPPPQSGRSPPVPRRSGESLARRATSESAKSDIRRAASDPFVNELPLPPRNESRSAPPLASRTRTGRASSMTHN